MQTPNENFQKNRDCIQQLRVIGFGIDGRSKFVLLLLLLYSQPNSIKVANIIVSLYVRGGVDPIEWFYY